jgi:hypothetical protein
MAFTITIKGNDLIEWIENNKGGVYENIKEDDRITNIQLRYGDDITVTIGDD